MQAARRRADMIPRAGSAGGPKPGRAGFYLELGRADNKSRLASVVHSTGDAIFCDMGADLSGSLTNFPGTV